MIVEDNRNISEMIGEYLEGAASRSIMPATAWTVTGWRRRTAYDAIVVLDLMLPRLDGIEVCRACAAMRASPRRC
jgi:DNA-binding response OmpR family regulator